MTTSLILRILFPVPKTTERRQNHNARDFANRSAVLSYVWESAFKLFDFDGVYRTRINTSAAVGTGSRVDYKFAIAFRDRAGRAVGLTSATANAVISDIVCHFCYLL